METDSLHQGLQTINIEKFARAILHTINKAHSPDEAKLQLQATQADYPALMVPHTMIDGYCKDKGIPDTESQAMRTGALITGIGLRELIVVERTRQ